MNCKVLLVTMLLCGGCGSELANIGGGIVAGGALSNTMTGAEKDLEAREAKLVELYNKGVEGGAQREYLDQIEKDIYDTRLGKQTLSTGKKLFSVDWQDPKAAGGGISLIATLAYAYYKRKDLLAMTKKNTGLEKGLNRVKGEAEPELAKRIHDVMKIYI
ncbi:hypothetical protein LCGC14_1383700 [marine sediment metagenome]|uniref:Uncharacterized protein n=1 Tax=marine sediment metagenome TaxID=412755 RepID=A0A0F9K256_9ZZZZ